MLRAQIESLPAMIKKLLAAKAFSIKEINIIWAEDKKIFAELKALIEKYKLLNKSNEDIIKELKAKLK